MTRRWKVLLCGYYGMGNSGDELLAAASLNLLRSCGVSNDLIVMLSGDPESTRQIHHVQAINRWDPRQILETLARSETLLLGGGGIFQDSTSARSPWYYWLIVRAAWMLGCRVWAAGQSVGPLSRKLNRVLTQNAFAACRAVSVRDSYSAQFLRKGTVLTDDLVLSLQLTASPKTREYFLVNFRAVDGDQEYRAAAAAQDYASAHGLKMAGVAMDRADAVLMEEMSRRKVIALEELFAPGPVDLPRVFSRGVSAFGMRLHFGVCCLEAGVPCVLVPYDPKVRAFAERWGAPLWTQGPLEASAGWSHADRLPGIEKKIERDFTECFQKVMSS